MAGRMSLKMTRPTVVLTIVPGVNSFSPSPLSFLCGGRRSLIIAWTPTSFWLKARKTSLGLEKTIPSFFSPGRLTVR